MQGGGSLRVLVRRNVGEHYERDTALSKTHIQIKNAMIANDRGKKDENTSKKPNRDQNRFLSQPCFRVFPKSWEIPWVEGYDRKRLSRGQLRVKRELGAV